MKLRLLIVPAILVMTAAVADNPRSALSEPADAQAQAAALLSRSHMPQALQVDGHSSQPSSASAAVDAQASAATLLSGVRPGGQVKASFAFGATPATCLSADARAQAAALLNGPRTSVDRCGRNTRKTAQLRAGNTSRIPSNLIVFMN
jgi:hypothetical protein